MFLLIVFGGTIVTAVTAFWLNVRLLKGRVLNWDSTKTVFFIATTSSFGSARRRIWVEKLRCADDEIRLIAKYQRLSVLETFLGGFLLFQLYKFLVH